jgi:hypothetical protein
VAIFFDSFAALRYTSLETPPGKASRRPDCNRKACAAMSVQRLTRAHFALYRGYLEGASIAGLHAAYGEPGTDVRVAATDQRTEQTVQPCPTPRRPDEIGLPNFCTLPPARVVDLPPKGVWGRSFAENSRPSCPDRQCPGSNHRLCHFGINWMPNGRR